MLASITPLGERGRRSTWGVTVTAFALGGTVAGAVTGAVLGALGALVLGGVTTSARLVALAAGISLAAALDLLPARVPGPRRQVNERWLDEFRGWVYGAGFGAQLGFGLSTVVTSAATYAAWLAALLSASAARGAAILGVYGAVRGLTPLLASRVREPEALVVMHRRIERLRRPALRAAPVVLGALVLVCVGGAL